ARDDRHHRDDGRDADHDAERREAGPQLVLADRAEREPHVREESLRERAAAGAPRPRRGRDLRRCGEPDVHVVRAQASYLRASTGGSFAAADDGARPARMPVSVATPRPTATKLGWMAAGKT